MHSGSTALRTPAALMIEKTAMLAEHVEKKPVAEEKGNQALCPAAQEHSMLNAEEQAADRSDRIRQYKQFAARAEKRRQLEDAARAQTKQDDADAELHMLLNAEVEKQAKQDQAAQHGMIKDPVRPKLTPQSANKAHKDAVELAEVNELLDALELHTEQINPQDGISFSFREPPRSSVVLPAEKLVLGNMVQSENPHRAFQTRNPRKTLPNPSMGHDLFAHPQMTLSDAAIQVQTYLNAARGLTSHWCEMGDDRFSNCLSDPLLQRHIEDLTRDLNGTAAFLSYGRLGWELQDLPREVFEEAELLLPELRAHLIHVTQYKGGERLTEALIATENIEARLKDIWLIKLGQGDQRPDEDMDGACWRM
ncbi:hypothetical protein HII31_02265 [Pseudocercospora fuligena]|uniref:Uncharacterized protein n=1 Tax=Pseudocercospora fuligena TaxID=685502 RepID=A0A8H6RTF2_9PEZI|nr:hypothetical protein HII31_02265 [Pseudocercospora fuligena]